MGSPRQPAPIGYVEHAAPADLSRAVQCVWTRTYSSDCRDVGHLVLPDGAVEFVFAFGDAIDARAVGQLSMARRISGPPPRLCLGIRVAPAFAGAVLGIPATELLDRHALYGDVVPDAEMDMEMLCAAPSPGDRIAAAFALVRRRLTQGVIAPRAVRAAVAMIVAREGKVRVDSLAAEMGITRQHLTRLFAVHVGLSPKGFARVIRMRGALARADAAHARRPGDVNWSRIAQELGYCDQSHFIGEFKSLTDSSPGDWHRYGAP